MQSQTLWVAFYVLIALFVAAVLMRTLRRLFGRRPASPLRGAAPGGLASARQAYAAARTRGEHVIGWKLDPEDRERLLRRFPPAYTNVVADHVTLKAHVASDAELPPETHGAVVGRSDDLKGVEALVVRLVDTTERPDGSTYHLTWSLAEGRRAQESNDVIASQGWQPVDPPVAIRLQPQRFP
jgi:hypothetical protein